MLGSTGKKFLGGNEVGGDEQASPVKARFPWMAIEVLYCKIVDSNRESEGFNS